MKKHFFPAAVAWMLVLLCLLSVSARADYDHFDDVNARAWYADAVNWAVLSAVTDGTSDKTFSPDKLCTRAQAVTFLWRANGCPAPKGTKVSFADVPAGCYFENAVLWAVEKGYVSGSSAAAFLPEDRCTCGQLLTMLWRSEGRPDPEMPSEITAGWPEGEEKAAVAWAESKGMLSGADVPAEKFDPAAGCTRAAAVKYLYDASFRFVTTVDQLVNALGPCRNICLAPGEYNLTEWMLGASEETLRAAPYIRVEGGFDGLELQIVGLEHVTFSSPTHDPSDVRIVVEPRYANVLSFLSCNRIVLRDLTMGHTPDQGYCTGGVVYLEDCGSVFLQNLDLYGCGTYGLSAFDTETVYAANVVIHDCSYGGLELHRVSSASFTDCTVQNCREFDILTFVDSKAQFTRCAFRGNEWGEFSDFLSLSGSQVSFSNCTFDRPSYFSIVGSSGYERTVKMSGATVEE